ncbi:MAG TPA: radical SAM protein [Smithellaceae bacterium]|nr:radical SAM protein [Smithellaceae bacterium]
MRKLVLISPIERKTSLGAYKSTSIAPLALACIAALTPEDKYQISIIDEHIEPVNYPEADLVGITSYTAHIRRSYEVADEYRKRNVPVVMGGIHVSTMPDEALEHCDAVVIGEAEGVWGRVLEDFEQGRLQRKYQAEHLPLDNMPFPKRQYLKTDRYFWGMIQTSRGCPMDCSFCSVTMFNGRDFRRRKVEDVIAELSGIPQKFVIILDDNILGHEVKDSRGNPIGKAWLRAFFEAVIKNKIRKYFYVQASMKFGEDVGLLQLAYRAGVRLALVGIESIEEASLKAYCKNLNASYARRNCFLELISNIRKSGIAIVGCFILGSDTDTKASFGRTLDFIRESGIDIIQVTKPTPLPGTRFYKELFEQNRILDIRYPEAWKDYTFTRMLFKPRQLDIEDVYEGFHYIKMNFYATPAKIKRFFRTLWDTKSLSSTAMMQVINHTYQKSFFDSDLYRDYDMRRLKEKFNP